MSSVHPQKSSEKYLHPLSAATSRDKLSHAAGSREKLLRASFVDIPLNSLSSTSPKAKSARSIRASTSNLSLASWPGHPRPAPKQLPFQIDDHVLALSVTITLALLILIGVPLAAVLPQKYVVPLPVNVLVPFYVYPDTKSWDRLFDACIKHPRTNFAVIISIDHGPSDTAWPSGVYIAPIKRLNRLPNVQTIGYVDTAYGSRDNETVRKEIVTYAGWNNSGIAISGIFFDHTPAEDMNNARAYLKNVSVTVRHSEGFLEPSLVVHNPGKVPEKNMKSYHADVTVVFDGEFKDMPERKELKAKLRDLNGRREDFAEIVHSVPRTISRGGVRKIINSARRNVGWLFVTDRLGDNKYEWYSDRWEEFLDLTW